MQIFLQFERCQFKRLVQIFLHNAGKLYAIGGCNNSTCLSSVEVYDATRDEWTAAAKMRKARACLAAAEYKEQIYATGKRQYVNVCKLFSGMLVGSHRYFVIIMLLSVVVHLLPYTTA